MPVASLSEALAYDWRRVYAAWDAIYAPTLPDSHRSVRNWGRYATDHLSPSWVGGRPHADPHGGHAFPSLLRPRQSVGARYRASGGVLSFRGIQGLSLLHGCRDRRAPPPVAPPVAWQPDGVRGGRPSSLARLALAGAVGGDRCGLCLCHDHRRAGLSAPAVPAVATPIALATATPTLAPPTVTPTPGRVEVALLLPTPTPAPGGQTLTLVPRAGDAGWWASGDTRANHLGDSFLYAGRLGDQQFLSMVRFDLTRVPRGAVIEQATLRLTGLDDRRFDPADPGLWLVQLIAEADAQELARADYVAAYSRPAAITLAPLTAAELGAARSTNLCWTKRARTGWRSSCSTAPPRSRCGCCRRATARPRSLRGTAGRVPRAQAPRPNCSLSSARRRPRRRRCPPSPFSWRR